VIQHVDICFHFFFASPLQLDEAKVKFENAVRAEHTALSRINEVCRFFNVNLLHVNFHSTLTSAQTQLQLEACEAELASVRASTKARLVQAEQVLTQLLSANDVRETELARLRAAEVRFIFPSQTVGYCVD
jgi:hypothetical protein